MTPNDYDDDRDDWDPGDWEENAYDPEDEEYEIQDEEDRQAEGDFQGIDDHLDRLAEEQVRLATQPPARWTNRLTAGPQSRQHQEGGMPKELHYDDSGYYGYLNASNCDRELLASKVISPLVKFDLMMLASGVCRRDANNGKRYHWWVRLLDRKTRQKPTRDRVLSALKALGVEALLLGTKVNADTARLSASVAPQAPEVRQLSRELAALRQQIEQQKSTIQQLDAARTGSLKQAKELRDQYDVAERRYAGQLGEAKQQIEDLTKRLLKTQADLLEQQSKHDEQVSSLYDEIRWHAAREVSAGNKNVDQVVIQLTEELKQATAAMSKLENSAKAATREAQKAREEAEAANEYGKHWEIKHGELTEQLNTKDRETIDLANEVTQIQFKLSLTEGRLTDAELAAREAKLQLARNSGASNAGASEMTFLLEALLPSIRFEGGSLDLIQEMKSPIHLLRGLVDFDRDYESACKVRKATVVKKAPGVREIRLSDGEKRACRVYAWQTTGPTGKNTHVLVGDKGNQSLDIDWLVRNARPNA